MQGRISLPTLCHFLLPWAFTTFHRALGSQGKTLIRPRIWRTVVGKVGRVVGGPQGLSHF